MDGLSALSVAASITQFINFGCSLVLKTKEIYKSADGAFLQHAELDAATKRLVELSGRIKTPVSIGRQKSIPSPDDTALQTICDGCISVSNELLAKLDKLRIQDGQRLRLYKSFRQALKSVWSKTAVDEVANRLNDFRKEMDSHILVSLSEKFNNLSILQDEGFTSLDIKLQRMIEPLLRYLIDIHAKIEDAIVLHNTCSTNSGQIRARADVCTCPAEYTALRNRELGKAINGALLKALQFPTMSHRRLEIADAHRRTFSWLFKQCSRDDHADSHPRHEARPWSNFVQWLCGDEGLYWITGKPGSGKSTLMRFISEHPETRSHLRSWAQNANFQASHFYFWNSGTTLQRSQSGLLRSLLYDVLSRRPEIISTVFADQWTEAHSSHFVHRVHCVKHIDQISQRYEWTFHRKDLESAFASLADLATDRFKLCFFIDGLDEYEGDGEQLAELVKTIAKRPYVKFCLSSRPWPEFEEAFQGCPSLRVQDLTYEDIRLYVQEKFQGNQKMQALKQSNPTEAVLLVSSIVTKANGVFLWVRIIVRSLFEGLRNRDSISDLQERLKELPSDLDSLYDVMIGRINPCYIGQASQIFQIYDSISDLNLKPSTLELELAISATSEDTLSSTDRMSDQEIETRCDKIVAHLKSRCVDLLEVHDILDRNWEDVDDLDNGEHKVIALRCEKENGDQIRLRAFSKVSYLHRTVKDFLKMGRVRAKFQHHTSSFGDFDPNLFLLTSYLVNLRRSLRSFYITDEESEDQRIRMTARDALVIARKIIDQGSNPQNLLWDFYELISRWRAEPALARTGSSPSAGWRKEFLSRAAYNGLWNFIEADLKQQTQLSTYNSTRLLCYALGLLHPPRFIHLDLHTLDSRMVSVLLQHGANPNEYYQDGHSVWQGFLHHVVDTWQNGMAFKISKILWTNYARTMLALLEYSPEPVPCAWNPRCTLFPEDRRFLSLDSIINDVFSRKLPEEAAALRTSLETRRSNASQKRKQEIVQDLIVSKRQCVPGA